MKLYKLTDQNHQTHGGCQWGEGVTHEADGQGEMCGPGWLHAYKHPLLVVLLNPIHADFKSPVLWESEGEIEKDDGLKVGSRKLTTLRIIPLPTITIEQKIKFAILCAKKVCKDPAWNLWADRWLSGEDGTAGSARAARAPWTAWTAARSAARSASEAVEAAARAAEATADIDLIAIAEEAMR